MYKRQMLSSRNVALLLHVIQNGELAASACRGMQHRIITGRILQRGGEHSCLGEREGRGVLCKVSPCSGLCTVAAGAERCV